MDMAFRGLLTGACEIERSSFGAENQWGEKEKTIETVVSSEPCLWQQMGEDIEINKKGRKIYTRYIIFFMFTANVLEGDILTISNKKYLVVSVEDAASQQHHLEVWVEALEN